MRNPSAKVCSKCASDHGPGYRVYYVRRGQIVVVLLCGGDKRGQPRDIKRARALAATLED
jgi:putative addiction module killer protein